VATRRLAEAPVRVHASPRQRVPYETDTLPAEQTGAALVLAFVGRARRLLRAAYLLADSGLEPDAGGPRRAFIEYVLMVRWLLSNDDTNNCPTSASTSFTSIEPLFSSSCRAR
jgi:hypothetical protein